MRYQNLYKVQKIVDDPLKETSKQYRPLAPLASVIPDYKDVINSNDLLFSWLGHSSVFLHMSGYNILIDPVFSEVISPLKSFGLRRFEGPIPNAHFFPELDAILITHSHRDHLDKKTLLSLDKQTQKFIVPMGLRKTLKHFGIVNDKIVELNWHESYSIGSMTVHCCPAHHNSTRWLVDQNWTLWCSYVLTDNRHTVFHSGDTAYSPHFNDIHKQFSHFDLAFIECGQYGKQWHYMHMFPEESVQACVDLNVKMAIPIHWGAYVLSTHCWDEPIRRFNKEANRQNVPFQTPNLYQIEKFQ